MKKYLLVNNSSIVIAAFFTAFTSVLPIASFVVQEYLIGTITAMVWIASAIVLLNNIFNKKLEISEIGVKLKSNKREYLLTWDSIKEVGIGYSYVGIKGGVSMLYFSTETMIGANLSPDMVSEKLIMMRFRKGAIEEICKYWKGEIYGIERK